MRKKTILLKGSISDRQANTNERMYIIFCYDNSDNRRQQEETDS